MLNAKYQAKIRAKQLDTKRRKLKEDLEAREEAHRKSLIHGKDNRTDEQRLQVFGLFNYLCYRFIERCF